MLSITTPTGGQSSDSFTYTVYKIFDATSNGSSVSYTKLDSETTWPIVDDENAQNQTRFYSDGSNVAYAKSTDKGVTWTKDESGSGDLTAAMVTKLGTLTDQFTKVGTVKIEGAGKTGYVKLDYGYYYVTSTTGSVVAINTNKSGAEIGDKNSVPTVDKTITGVDDGSETTKGSVDTTSTDTTNKNKRAIAEAGSTVHFQSVITVGKGAANYEFTDLMSSTLKLNSNSIQVTYKTPTMTEASALTYEESGTQDYSLNLTPVTAGVEKDQYTFKISFDKTTEAAKAAMTEGTVITVTYTATVEDDGLQTNPGNNRAKVYYGSDPDAKYETTPSETKVYNAKVTLVKRAGSDTGDYLANAGFKLKNSNISTAKYYKLTTTGEAPNQTKAVSWVDAEQGDQLYSGPDGKLYTTKVIEGTGENKGKYFQFAADGKTADTSKPAVEASFTGLSNGTYYLEETTVPDGYNKAADTEVTINDANSENAFVGDKVNTNLYQSKTIVNRTGSLLPSTGGIGTTIFYVIGGVLIAGAAILLITRRKKA